MSFSSDPRICQGYFCNNVATHRHIHSGSIYCDRHHHIDKLYGWKLSKRYEKIIPAKET